VEEGFGEVKTRVFQRPIEEKLRESVIVMVDHATNEKERSTGTDIAIEP
jgi:hypothetical protein